MSWDLRVGEMQTAYLTEQEVWQAIQYFFYRGKQTTTYKFGFFKALMESAVHANAQHELSFDTIFYSFTKIYWNLVVHHDLHQTNSRTQISSIQQVVQQFARDNYIPSQWNFDKLADEQKISLVKKVKAVGKKYVIGAIYGDFSRNIYTFDLRKEYLQLHPQFLKTFQTFRRILTNVTNYQLALFLERFNDVAKVQSLLTTVEFVTARQSLKEFQILLQQAGVDNCFYCQKSLKEVVHVDHFIPWSYFQNDLLWNFVLACPTCNRQKSDKLASPVYLEQLIVRNDQFQRIATFEGAFENYEASKVKKLYYYAQNSGFHDNWAPAHLS